MARGGDTVKDLLSKLSGNKTYILVGLAMLFFAGGAIDKPPIEITPEQSKEVGGLLIAAAIGTLRMAVAKVGS